jgi:bifunctional non-homologous end joining protein LigD
MPETETGLQISHPDKVFWPEEGYTKRDLASFYDLVFARLKPWVDQRLLTLERCPDGVAGECFFEKEAPAGLPPGTPTKAIRHSRKTTHYVVGGKRDVQIALVNLGCIAVHAWSSRADDPRNPDLMCFDLDPSSENGFPASVKAALLLRKCLDQLELPSYPKTSGGKGMHVFVPLRVGPDTDEVLAFAREVCHRLAEAHPNELTVETRIAKRKGRLYLDAGRNGFGQTVVTPYSVRARLHAPVSTTLDWSEVDPSLDPTTFNIGNYHRRLEKADPWDGFWDHRSRLPTLDSLR